MKIIMEVPDNKAAFVIELLQSLPFVKAKPVRSKAAKAANATTHLLSTEANRTRLEAAVQRANQDDFEANDLITE
jgi:hypothetical protein